MCLDPISGAALATGAIGQAVSGYEQSQSNAAQINARNATTQAEMQRQKAYGDQTRGVFDKALTTYAPGAQTQGLSDAQASFGDTLTRNRPTNVGSITTTGAPSVVGDSENARLGSVFKRAASNDQHMATLKGYGQQQFGNNIALNNSARDIDMIGDFSKVSSGVSGVEGRAAAQNAIKPPSGIGDLLKFAGTVGANQAGRGNLSLPSSPGTGYAGPYI